MTDSLTLGKTIVAGCALVLALSTTACTKKSFYPYPIPTGYHYNADEFKKNGAEKGAIEKDAGVAETEMDTKQRDAVTKTEADIEAEARAQTEAELDYILENEDLYTEDRAPGWDYERATERRRAPADGMDTDERLTDTGDESLFTDQTMINRNAPPAVWRSAAEELIDQMIANLGTPAETIYLRPETTDSNFNPSFEVALRRALEDRGLVVSPVQGGGPFALTYNIEPAGYGTESLKLEIWLSSGYKVANEESVIYNVETAPDEAGDSAPISLKPRPSQESQE